MDYNKWNEAIQERLYKSPTEIFQWCLSRRLNKINLEYIHQLELERQSIDYSKVKKLL